MQGQSYHATRHGERIERLKRLLATFEARYGPAHPLTVRIAEQLSRARQATTEAGT